MQRRWIIIALSVFVGACEEVEEQPAGALGGLCSDDDPCVDGLDPRCVAPELDCGLGPPFISSCDQRARCIECGGAERDASCPAPLEGQFCRLSVVERVPCGEEGLLCVEAEARAGGVCQQVPEACELADVCGCGDALDALCDGASPSSCLQRPLGVACTGNYN